MPSVVEAARRRRAVRATVSLALATLLLTLTAIGATAATAVAHGEPTDEQIHAAVTKLNTDPNLGVVKKSRRLQWKQTKDASSNKPESPSEGDWLRWLADAIGWFASTARALLWVIGVLLAGILGLYIKRFLELRGSRPAALRIVLPTHVRDLDIRPESLPDNIGASALELWERGEHRAALALLYRGGLSRLAHLHGVPIRDSSTEGDCLRLANAHLPAATAGYVGQLIRVWQRAVYGNTDPTDEEIRSLCVGFADALDKSTFVEQAA